MNNLGKNKQLILSKHPTGLTEIDDFEVREVEVPEISDGEILIQTHYVGVDAALRLIASSLNKTSENPISSRRFKRLYAFCTVIIFLAPFLASSQ